MYLQEGSASATAADVEHKAFPGQRVNGSQTDDRKGGEEKPWWHALPGPEEFVLQKDLGGC